MRSAIFLLLVAISVTGCGLLADAIENKLQPKNPVEQAKERANSALRDRFLQSIGVDPSLFSEPQPLSFAETVSVGASLEQTSVPSSLRFNERKGFRLSDFQDYMWSTYGVRLREEKSQEDPETGNRITWFYQVHEDIKVFGTYYRAVAAPNGEIKQAFGTVYDDITVSTKASLSANASFAALKNEHPEVTDWQSVAAENFSTDTLPAAAAVYVDEGLVVLPRTLNVDKRDELCRRYTVGGISNSSEEDIFLGATTAGIRLRLSLVLAQNCNHRHQLVTTEVPTLFHGRRRIPLNHHCIENPTLMYRGEARLAFGLRTMPKIVQYYSLDNSDLDEAYAGFRNIQFRAPFDKSEFINNEIICETAQFTCNNYHKKGYFDGYWALKETLDYYAESFGRRDYRTLTGDRLTVKFG
ncbi:MAG: hypothetical protein AAGF89_17355, partial [Bacteroidota bacterium]